MVGKVLCIGCETSQTEVAGQKKIVQQVFEMTLFRGLFSSEKQFTREKFTWEFYSNSWEKQCKTVRCSSILALHFTRNRHVAVTFVLFEQYYATEGWFTLLLWWS